MGISRHNFKVTPLPKRPRKNCLEVIQCCKLKYLTLRQKRERWLNDKALSIDELWMLHEAIGATLAEKIATEKKVLEERLSLLSKTHVEQTVSASGHRRPYPPVLPKFRNPDEPSETWAGRGKQPRWLRKQLRSGRRMDDFRIESVAA